MAASSNGVGGSRHFSAFPLTSHLHTPVLRLVSLHPALSLSLSFLRVPEIHDEFQYRVFFGRTTVVSEVIVMVLKELGLVKALPVPGGGSISYVVEEVWVEGDTESMFILFTPAHIVDRWFQNPHDYRKRLICSILWFLRFVLIPSSRPPPSASSGFVFLTNGIVEPVRGGSPCRWSLQKGR